MRQRQSLSGFGFIVLAIMIVVLAAIFSRQDYSGKITTQEFLTELEVGNVASTILKPSKETPAGELIPLTKDNKEKQLYHFGVETTGTFLLEHEISYELENVPQENYLLTIILPIIVSAVMLVGLFTFISARAAGSGGANARVMDFNKSRVKMDRGTGKTGFKKVAGLREGKEDLEELVNFLRDPQKYTAVDTRIPKGVILMGPPGTDKTLLTKAVVGEAGVPFFSISSSDFAEMFVGVSASRVRDLLEKAKKNAPCIVFIDEANVMTGRRGTGMSGGHGERGQISNQLLIEMDGSGVNEDIIVMATTNHMNILGSTILRLGCFDRKIEVGRPDVEGREGILKVHSKRRSLGEDVDLGRVAGTTSGLTGAGLRNLLNKVVIVAAREGYKFIQQADIDRSFIKVGIDVERHSRVIPKKEEKITAYHEARRTILSHVLPDVESMHTVSIIPAGTRVADYTMPLPGSDELFSNKGKMLQNIIISLGERIAEEAIFGDTTAGASQDVRQVTNITRAMTTRCGMSNKVDMINYGNDDDEASTGKDLAHVRGYREHVASAIDSEVKRIIDERYEKAGAIIQEHMSILHRCTELLIEKEKIRQEEFESLLE